MKRKVIKQGKQAFTITLPVKWIRENKIDANTELQVSENQKSLTISTDNASVEQKTKVDLHETDHLNVYRHLSSAYAKGIDELEIRTNEDLSKIIIKAVSQLPGFALISQDKEKYVIKDFGIKGYENLDEIFKRVFQMVLSFFDSAIKDVFGKNEETLDGLRLRDREVNKFCLFLQRSINKQFYKNQNDGRILFTYSYALEQIGDEIQRMWRTSIKHSPERSKEIKKMAENSYEGLAKAFDNYYSFKPKNVEEIYRIREKVRKKSMEIKTRNQTTIRFIRHIVKIVEEAADLSHLTIMRNI